MVDESTENNSITDSLATVFTGGLLVSIGKLFALGFGFLVQVTMARLLTEAEYGDVVLVIAVINIAVLIAKFGLDDGVVREYPHYEDDPAKAFGVIRSSLVLAGVSGILTASVLFFLSPIIANSLFNDPSLTLLLRITALSIPFLTINDVAISLAQGARDARVHTIVRQLIQPFLRFILILILILLGYGVFGAIIGQTLSLVLAGILAIILTILVLPSFDVQPESMYRSVLLFSIPLIAVQGMGFLNRNVDIYMVGYYLSSSDLGIYNIALQLGNLISAMVSTFGFLLPPMLTRLYKNNNNTEMRRVYQILTKWLVVSLLPVIIVLFLAPELIIGLLFGDKYSSGALALQILLIGKFVSVLMGLNTAGLIALGDNKVVSYIVILQTIINVVINILLIPIIGIEGGAIGMIISSIVGDIIGVSLLYSKYDIHPFTKATWIPVSYSICLTIIGYVIIVYLSISAVTVILLIGVLYFPITATLAVEPEDKQLLDRVEEHTGYDLSIVRSTISWIQYR